jgi:hypothetical protein
MKICPACRTTYDDDGLNFCLEDGSLLTGYSVDPAAATVVMDYPRRTEPSALPTQGIQTSWDANEAPRYAPKQRSSKAWVWVLGIMGLLVLLCGGGFVGFFVYVASVANSNQISTGNVSRTANTTPGPGNSGEVRPSPSTSDETNRQEINLAEWVKDSPVWGTTEFKDGEFLMSAKQKGYYYVLVAPDDYETEAAATRVTVRNPESAESSLRYGLIFHSDSTPLEEDYAFLIDSMQKRFRVVRHQTDRETTITGWTNSKLIKDGASENILEVRDLGEKIELYINGQLATTVTNKQGPTSGVPGLYAGDGLKIGFKNLEVVK